MNDTVVVFDRLRENRRKYKRMPLAELIDLSVKLYGEGKYLEMVAACDLALRLQPDSAEAWNNKCSAYNQLGRFAEAASACEAALRYKPDFPLAKNNLAVARSKTH